MAHAIFFEDLTKEGQKQIIEDEFKDSLNKPYDHIEAIYVEKDTYGYHPNPKNQTLEQHIHARISKHTEETGREVHQWLMIWDCWKHEFHTIMEEDTNEDSFKEQMTLHGIIVEYKEYQKADDAVDATIHICVNAGYHDYLKREPKQFTAQEDITVSKDISENDLYELAKKYYSKLAFVISFIDERMSNGCKYRDTAKAIGEKMPDVIQAISKHEEYKYIVKQED